MRMSGKKCKIMSSEDIEKEIEERVVFKMNELLKGMHNVANLHWQTAFHSGNPKYQHYQEAFQQMQLMFKKELEMATPCTDMWRRSFISKINLAHDNIIQRLNLRGTKEREPTERFIYNELKKLGT